ncbi:MAG TPA: hypothetical protein VE779_06090 [Candidatus Angelobacter sp.]|nr:hypothetical protein [Candidatus Angelobacter sp.]
MKKLGLGGLALALAFIVCAVLLTAVVDLTGSGRRITQNVQVAGPGARPRLIFACELDDAPLAELFADPTVIQQLQGLGAEVALALKDFTPQRADVVRQLNRAGVPVTAWLALPKEQGYYLNAGNAPEAVARYRQFLDWTAMNQLHWAAIGLDVEPNLSEFAALKTHPLALAASVLRRAFDSRRVSRATQQYSALIRQIQADGYSLQTYQFVILADERLAGSTALERLLGLVDVRGNHEVLMAYTSFNHHLDSALIWAYGPDAQILAIGSTGPSGDPALDARFPPLDWSEFSRDLITAAHFTPVIGVFSLEGCVRQGFLLRLADFNWSQSVTIPADAITKVQRFRRAFQIALWTASHLPLVLLLFLAACGLAWLALGRWTRRVFSLSHHTQA